MKKKVFLFINFALGTAVLAKGIEHSKDEQVGALQDPGPSNKTEFEHGGDQTNANRVE